MADGIGSSYPNLDSFLGKYLDQNPVPPLYGPNADPSIKSLQFPFIYEPGTSWQYSCGLDWAGILVERISGTSLDEYMKKNIFDPCAAGSLTFYPTDENRKHRMTLCSRDEDGQVIPTTDGSWSRPRDMKFCSGGAGLYGTQKDYLAVLRAVLQSDPKSPHLSSSPLLSPESFAELFSPSLGNDNKDGPEKIANMVSSGNYYPARPDNMNHSVGGILNLEDREGGRKANSVSWAGVAKSEWWIDHTSGLAVCPSFWF